MIIKLFVQPKHIYIQTLQIQLLELMFVKESYDNRIKKEQFETNTRTLLRKNKVPAIGSIRNDKINYDQDEQFFAKEDVPEKARNIKNDVKKYIDPDHLGLRKRQWNTSVSVPKKIQSEETHQQRLLKIKLGFLDHPLPTYKQPKIYDGTDTRNDYTNWNVSNQVSRKQFRNDLMKKTMSALENSKLKQKQYLSEYMDPLMKTTNFIDSFKNDWKQKQILRQQLMKKYEFDNPNASQQKKQGAVFRLVYETMIKQRKDNIQAQAMKTDFKATLSGTQKNRIGVRSSHTGVWQSFKQKVGQQIQQTWAWSCCMNQDQNSPGCSNKIKDGNKWNLISFNS